MVNFSAAYLAELTRSFPGVDFCGFLNEKENHLLHTLTPRQQNYVYALLRQLLALADDTGRQVCAAKKLLLGTLLLYLQKQCRLQRELGCGSGRVTNCLVDQVQGYVVQHYAEKLTLPQIAARFYISPCYLSRLFKRTINLSLVEYINGVRVKAAQRQLEKTRRSISEVAADTGFSTVAHFRRCSRGHRSFAPAVPPVFAAPDQRGRRRGGMSGVTRPNAARKPHEKQKRPAHPCRTNGGMRGPFWS